MTKGKALAGKLCAENPHLWIVEMGVASMATPRCGTLPSKMGKSWVASLAVLSMAMFPMHVSALDATTLYTVCQSAHGIEEKVFAVSAGQAGLIGWNWKCSDLAMTNSTRTTFELRLPRGFAFLDAAFGDPSSFTTEPLPDGGSSVTFRAAEKFNGVVPGREYTSWNMLGVLIESTGSVGTSGSLEIRVFRDGELASNVETTRLETVEAIHAARPHRCRYGMCVGGLYDDFQTSRARERYIDFAATCGMSWRIAYRRDVAYRNMWRRRGFLVTPSFWHLCMNGFCLGRGEKRPENERYVAINPKRTPYNQLWRASCPTAILAPNGYFATKTAPELANFLEGCDGLWMNWEPYEFRGNGCICDRCRRAFAEYTGLPEDEVAAGWPKELDRKHGKWSEEIRRFRSWQHSQIVRKIDGIVRAATGGEKSVGAIPGVCWRDMSSFLKTEMRVDEIVVSEYAGSFKWMNPWGPYVFWNAAKGKTLEKPGETFANAPSHVLHWLVARDVREQVDKDYPLEGGRPKLMAFPHGVQAWSWLTKPKWLGLACDAFFFWRWESVVPYNFPYGYDARYWREVADSAARAAKWEDFVFEGTCADAMTIATPTLATARTAATPPRFMLQFKDKEVPLFNTIAYDNSGSRLVAAFNFSDDGHVDFRLRLLGLSAEKYRLEAEEGDGGVFTTEELKRGIPLSIGACRCRTFLFHPER